MRVPVLVAAVAALIVAFPVATEASGLNVTYRLLGPGQGDIVLACNAPEGPVAGCAAIQALGYDGYNAVYVATADHVGHDLTCAIMEALLVTNEDALHRHALADGGQLLHLHEGVDVTVSCSP